MNEPLMLTISVCPIGFFGDACTQACHCTKGVRCFVANGTCMSRGCAQGWNGQACNIKDHSKSFEVYAI